jgi:hypothetical protein
MTQELLTWKLFPFSLMGEAKQWYTFAIESTNKDWEELKDKFCLAFFLCPISVLYQGQHSTFEQLEKESIDTARAMFSMLLHASPDLSLLENVLLHLFYTGLDIADLCLDMTARGRFTHKPMTEQEEFLENFKKIYTLLLS